MRKAFSLVIIVSLLASMAMFSPIAPVAADPTVYLKIVLPNGEQNMTVPPEWIGDNYNITIEVQNVTDLYTWAIKLNWNTSVCNYTGQDRVAAVPITLGPNDRIWLDPEGKFAGLSVVIGTTGINNTEGYLQIGQAGVFDPALAPDGNFTLCTIEFHVKDYGSNWIKFVGIGSELGTCLINPTPAFITFVDVKAPDPYSAFNADVFIVPEFPAHLLMPLLLIATITAVVLGKTTWSKRRRGRVDVI